jgi:hypothetical protein
MMDTPQEIVASLAEALEKDPHEGLKETCWCAMGRIVDDDPTYVFQDGDSNGMTATCLVTSGPFTGTEVTAMISTPPGAGFESRPIRSGQRVLLNFLEGRPDGTVILVATVPGGRENPIPEVIAGAKVDESALQKEILVEPPKGVNLRYYVRGGAFMVRLKGNEQGFVGEFYVEGDDGDAQGFHNTFIRLVRDPGTGKLGIKLKLADGTSLELSNGVAALTSANQKNSLQVGNKGVRIMGDSCMIDVGTIIMNGMIMENMPPGAPPIPTLAALHGPGGPATVPSVAHFIGK